MKFLNNILASAAAVLAVASCTIVPEDTFSTAPVAPVMSAHNDILITTATVDESVTFSWTEARYINAEEYVYDLFVAMGETKAQLANDLTDTYYTLTKTDFRTFMKDNFTLEQNSTHSISVYAAITDADSTVFAADPVNLKVYVYDDAVASVVEAEEDVIALDMNKPLEELSLLIWSEPRLFYGEDVTYKVTLKVGNGKEIEVANELFETSLVMTMDDLNEAVIEAGGVQKAENIVKFTVYACCASIPEGVPSNVVEIKVTTYPAVFPAEIKISAGSDVVFKHSEKEKGMYQGFVTFATEAEFLFQDPKDAEGDFGFGGQKSEDVVIDKNIGTSYKYITGSGLNDDKVKCGAGQWYVKFSKKFQTLEMIQVENLELVGNWDKNWNVPVKMAWDETAKSWSATEELVMDETTEFKVRFNSVWTHSFGGKLSELELGSQDNVKFTKAEATYKIILNASTSDFTLNAVDVNMPDYLVVAGNYSGHSWSGTDDMRIYLKDAEKGIYKGYITMYNGDQGFKFVKNGSVWCGQTATDGLTYTIVEGDAGQNCMIDNGTYYWEFDIANMTAKATLITKAGLIGSINDWKAINEMTFDEESLTYSIEQTFVAGDEFKFIFNDTTWTWEMGTGDEGLIHQGGNIKVETAGTYVVTLDMAHGSYPTYTLTAK